LAVPCQRALINRSTRNSDLTTQFIEKYVVTSDGLKTIDAAVPIGVPALKTLSDEMAANVMPNIPQMGKFWSPVATAFQVATSGQASPQAALDDAKKNMGK
jgi:maltose/maltodextrin transport system substrate-binding protein